MRWASASCSLPSTTRDEVRRPVRRALGVRTIFNFLGPLTNPAGARRQVIGVSDRSRLEMMAAALGELGTDRALVVSSADGLDEFSVSGATRVVELREGELATYEVTPEEVGLERAADGAVGAGTPDANARVLRRVLEGEPGTNARWPSQRRGRRVRERPRRDDSRGRAERRRVDRLSAALSTLEKYLSFRDEHPAGRARRRHARAVHRRKRERPLASRGDAGAQPEAVPSPRPSRPGPR